MSFPAFDRASDEFYDLVNRDVTPQESVAAESDYLRSANDVEVLEWLAVINEILDDLQIQREKRSREWDVAKEFYPQDSIPLNEARDRYTGWIRSVNTFERIVTGRRKEIKERLHGLSKYSPEFKALRSDYYALEKFVLSLAREGNNEAMEQIVRIYGAEKALELCKVRNLQVS